MHSARCTQTSQSQCTDLLQFRDPALPILCPNSLIVTSVLCLDNTPPPLPAAFPLSALHLPKLPPPHHSTHRSALRKAPFSITKTLTDTSSASPPPLTFSAWHLLDPVGHTHTEVQTQALLLSSAEISCCTPPHTALYLDLHLRCSERTLRESVFRLAYIRNTTHGSLFFSRGVRAACLFLERWSSSSILHRQKMDCYVAPTINRWIGT